MYVNMHACVGVYALAFISRYSTFSKSTQAWTRRRHLNAPLYTARHLHTYIWRRGNIWWWWTQLATTIHVNWLVAANRQRQHPNTRKLHLICITFYFFSILAIFISFLLFVKLNFWAFAFVFVSHFSLHISKLATVECHRVVIVGLLVSCVCCCCCYCCCCNYSCGLGYAMR